MKKRALAFAGVLLLLFTLLFPLSAFAADVEYYSLDISIELEENGTARVTESWHMAANAGTEMYLTYTNLLDQEISDLAVTGDGYAFENIGEWDSSMSFEDKAYKCGIINYGNSTELCWGLGSYGEHQFSVSYTLTNLVKQCADGAYIAQRFVNDFANPIGSVKITIRRAGLTFTEATTGVWASGTTGEIWVVDGAVVANTTGGYAPGSFFGVLVQFAEGMFSPEIYNSRDFETIRQEELAGTNYDLDDYGNNDYGDGDYGSYNVSTWDRIRWWFEDNGLLIVVLGGFVAVFAVASRAGHKASAERSKYKKADVPYSRELPWQGSVPATWARLSDLGMEKNESDIIGAYLLQWIRSRQVEIVKEQGGVFGNKEEDAIKLYGARPEMGGSERRLYDMLLSAAGSDYVLQSKEFEKWSRRNYEQVQGWLTAYKNEGKQAMRAMGAATEVQGTTFFGLVKTTKTTMSPLGEELTYKMLGFKKYLLEFTIINEREAREVQLWDDYLVFAQVFGIADEVAGQFRQLYPAYFTQISQNLNGVDFYDVIVINHLARNFAHSMHSGYRAGYNAAHSSSSSGGGGSFSGGGGFSGGSSSGGGGGGVR